MRRSHVRTDADFGHGDVSWGVRSERDETTQEILPAELEKIVIVSGYVVRVVLVFGW